MRNQPSTTIRSSASPLRRIPLVPDDILKKHNVYIGLDSRFRAAARLLQALWLKDHDIPTGVLVSTRDDVVTTMELGSLLSPEAARAGRNFLTPEIHNLVRRELVLREEGSVYDEARLFSNSVSSQPLQFNLIGPMAADLRLATAVFRKLLPEFVDSVEHFSFEHSPGRGEVRFLNDRSAFDVVVDVVTPDAQTAKIYVEIKYSEDLFGPPAKWRDRYNEAARQVRLYVDPGSQMLRSLAIEQLFRLHSLSQLAVDEGVTERALFLAVGPRLNHRVQSAFRVYETELIDTEDQDDNRVGFKSITIEQIIDAMRDAGAREIAQALWYRYADFDRIFDESLSAFDGDFAEPSSDKPALSAAVTASSSNRSRRAMPAAPRRRTRSTPPAATEPDHVNSEEKAS